MVSKKAQDALNVQINAELYSAYLYLSMAAYFESLNLKGFANWMQVQAQEEMVHVMKFYKFLLDRRGRVVLQAVAGPPTEWASPLAAMEATLAHEQEVTARINKLVDLSIAESDHATNALLQWFVTEQVEEESSADAVVQKLRLTADTPAALFMIDQELATRTFVPPPAAP
ncbi:MAG: ferritin [Pirellulales bacterium]|jgi:ferritin